MDEWTVNLMAIYLDCLKGVRTVVQKVDLKATDLDGLKDAQMDMRTDVMSVIDLD